LNRRTNPGSRGRRSAAPVPSWPSLPAILLALAAVSCDRAGGPPADRRVSGPAVTLEVIDPGELKTVVAGLTGKVVLVDYWATWCPPCVKQFPHTVETWRKLGPKGLEVISMSLDAPDDRQKALDFLTREGAGFRNFLSAKGGGTDSMEALDLDSGVPRYRVYDRKGSLRGDFFVDPAKDRQYRPEDIEAEAARLLEEK
jgi:thiol-disulfide isomerase/thioredoxin